MKFEVLVEEKWRVLGASSSDWAWVWDAVRAVQIAIDMGFHSNIVDCLSLAFAVLSDISLY